MVRLVTTFVVFATTVDAMRTISMCTGHNRVPRLSRRQLIGAASVLVGGSTEAVADSSLTKSRSDGYEIQRSEREEAYVLSGEQYYILRQGGTERPNSSILVKEKREGVFKCAGCGTPLFSSSEKFDSGTGWPSFAQGLKGVEIEDVSLAKAGLFGAELRCATCGGHLGDVFLDGKIFVNTPAFVSGKRFCIDGAALVFEPKDGSASVPGDKPLSVPKDIPDFLKPPPVGVRTT